MTDIMEKKTDAYIYLQTKSIIWRPVIAGKKDKYFMNHYDSK